MTIKEIHSIFLQSKGVITDSRIKNEGALFFALRGENFNGNDFVPSALENGCRYAIVDDARFKNEGKCIYVGNALRTLQELATFHRNWINIPVIGITGTNGKTTTKELVNAVLSKQYRTICTKGNFNNHIGVPLTLLSMTKEHEIAIIEMGANHPFEIAELCSISKPNFGIITSIGKAHLEGFGSFENIIKTKKELYDYVTSNNGLLFVNGTHELLMDISNAAKRITYGSSKSSETSGSISGSNPFVVIDYQSKNGAINVRTNLIGGYNFDNIMAAISVGQYFNVASLDIKSALEEYIPDNNRSQLVKTKTNTLILDAYNANPSSMSASIINFKGFTSRHKVAILGEMLELGAEYEKEHRNIHNLLKECDFEKVYLTGNWKSIEEDNYTKRFNSTSEMIEYFKTNPMDNKTILIKGSRGKRLETIVPFLYLEFQLAKRFLF